MSRRPTQIRNVPTGGKFYWTERGRIPWVSFGHKKESYLDMSGPSWMPYVEYARSDKLTKVKRTYWMLEDVWVDE